MSALQSQRTIPTKTPLSGWNLPCLQKSRRTILWLLQQHRSYRWWVWCVVIQNRNRNHTIACKVTQTFKTSMTCKMAITNDIRRCNCSAKDFSYPLNVVLAHKSQTTILCKMCCNSLQSLFWHVLGYRYTRAIGSSEYDIRFKFEFPHNVVRVSQFSRQCHLALTGFWFNLDDLDTKQTPKLPPYTICNSSTPHFEIDLFFSRSTKASTAIS